MTYRLAYLSLKGVFGVNFRGKYQTLSHVSTFSSEFTIIYVYYRRMKLYIWVYSPQQLTSYEYKTMMHAILYNSCIERINGLFWTQKRLPKFPAHT